MQTADFYSSATGTLRVNGGRDENAPQGVSLSIDDLSYIKHGSRANENSDSFTPTQAQLDAMNSGITKEDVVQISTNQNNISTVQTSLIVRQNDDGKVLTASYSGDTGSYSWVTPTALKSYTVSKPSDGSVNTATFDWPQLTRGKYLITCTNALGQSDRYGISVYVFEKTNIGSLELWTPISDITNAKISSYVVSGDTLTLTYDVQGYHTVKIVKFNT